MYPNTSVHTCVQNSQITVEEGNTCVTVTAASVAAAAAAAAAIAAASTVTADARVIAAAAAAAMHCKVKLLNIARDGDVKLFYRLCCQGWDEHLRRYCVCSAVGCVEVGGYLTVGCPPGDRASPAGRSGRRAVARAVIAY